MIGGSIGTYLWFWFDPDIYVGRFAEHCGSCHGLNLQGTDRGKTLISGHLDSGETIAGLVQHISVGNPAAGMPAFKDELTEEEIKGLAIYIAERRRGLKLDNFQFDRDIQVPTQTVTSEHHDFLLEVLTDDIDPQPFSIEPMPDGSILLTEKQRGLFVISSNGKDRQRIAGTPATGDYNVNVRGVKFGVGWLLDVALHPDYVDNGWIYLHYTHLCGDACGSHSILPKSFNRLERGRIQDNTWVDVEVLWEVDHRYYSPSPDTGAGGRIAFDDSGHVYISVGIKPRDAFMDRDAQDLGMPSGKVYRINDDGSIPADNPFVVSADHLTDEIPAFQRTLWTYGHRSPQGLEFNSHRQLVWESEMGPRGGDEINELQPGKNYGWPYHSLGLEYLGQEVARHRYYDIEFDESEVEKTLVDITPSPAASSFVFYDGDRFPAWKGNLLLGSLKGGSLYRMVFDERRLVHQEVLINNLARIRDIEVGNDGLIYLLIESEAGSKILRMKPATHDALALLE